MRFLVFVAHLESKYPKEDLPKEELEFDRDAKRACLRPWILRIFGCLHLDLNRLKGNSHTDYAEVKIAQRSLLVRSEAYEGQGIHIWQSITNSIILHESMPPDFLVTEENTILEDTEVEILCRNETL